MAKDADSEKIDYIQDKVDTVANTVANIDKELALHKVTFDAHLRQDEKMYDEFKRMNDILQQNTDSLKEHMHRTHLLEDLVAKMDDRLSPIELERIRKAAIKDWAYDKIKFVGKLGAAVAAITTAWMMVQPVIKHFLLK